MDQNCRNAIYSDNYFDLIVRYDRYADITKAFPGACSQDFTISNSILHVPAENIPDNMIQLYGYRIVPKCYSLLDTVSLEASGINKVRNIPALNLQGQGVLVGIIDTGIDYTNDAFRYADGTTKIVSIWDQSIPSETATPMGLNYGTEYSREQINKALANAEPYTVVPSVDEDGHGTYLSGIIAGNYNEEHNFSGVVPAAEIVIVKLKTAKANLKKFFRIAPDKICYQENDIMTGLKYLGDISGKLMRPISICIGLGTSQGAHDERSSLSNFITRLTDYPSIAITIAAGNEGHRGLHYFGSINASTGEDIFELKVGPNEYGFSMELWGEAPNTYEIDILSPSGEYISRIPARFSESREIRFLFEKTIISLNYSLIEPETGEQLILLRFQSPAEGMWRFRVYARGNIKKNYHVWMPTHNLLTNGTYFIKPNPNTTLTTPGNTNIPIVVTAYDVNTQNIFFNASRGYTRTGNISPSFAAPGVNVIGPAPNNRYVTRSGTSVAAAHTAGVAAMLLEWGAIRGNNTMIDTQTIKNLLIRGATRDANLNYPNEEWGYGKLDIYNTFASLRSNP
ncbi:MAG: hypothetical protein K0R92_1653 [Lachnospiraceae bacterium]|jgi:subtilisin family serine protease|nr:hypothetical protein [Lachnospiraceae bacterium]